jgi:hypothetical protein
MGTYLPSFQAMIPISNEALSQKVQQNQKDAHFGHVPIFIFILKFFFVLLCLLLWSPFEKFEN